MEKPRPTPPEISKTPELLLGCPVANGLPPCKHLCGGGWAGTTITHENMLKSLRTGRFDPNGKLLCGTLSEMAYHWYAELAKLEYLKE